MLVDVAVNPSGTNPSELLVTIGGDAHGKGAVLMRLRGESKEQAHAWADVLIAFLEEEADS